MKMQRSRKASKSEGGRKKEKKKKKSIWHKQDQRDREWFRMTDAKGETVVNSVYIVTIAVRLQITSVKQDTKRSDKEIKIQQNQNKEIRVKRDSS